ncbi:MAG: dockerin type I repeat-containing protein [Candidatus Zixiibacteriota bacterium]|nr:MAG: dockerin type I repeat-containing protein [candidate division Zixibacteria bacterium]
MKKSAFLLTIVALLSLAVVLSAQEPLPAIYVDLTEVEGLDENGCIPEGGADLVIPIHFLNSDGEDDFRTWISNGFYFDSPDGVTITGIDFEKNCEYNIDLACAISNECYPFEPFNCYSWFDMYFNDIQISKGLGGIGITGLAENGTGLPPGFDDWIYRFTVKGITGAAGTRLVLDSTSWEPYWIWMWDIPGIPSWGGPYEFSIGSWVVPHITSAPPTASYCPGDAFYYDVDADGAEPLAYTLAASPAGMTIDPATGEINWVCGSPGYYWVKVVVSNDHGVDEQSFVIDVISCAYTRCWPQPVELGVNDNDGILNVSIFSEYNDKVDLASVRVFGKIPSYSNDGEAWIEGDSIVTDCFLMRFLGSGGFRPLPPDDFTGEYFVTYSCAGETKTLVGDYAMNISQGDVNFDGSVNLEDVVLMIDWLFNGGAKTRLYNESMDECMDIDGSGRIDLLDVRALIEMIY